MRVGIDAHAIGTGAGGNETYMRELLYGLRDHVPELDVIAYLHRDVDQSLTAGIRTYRLRSHSSILRLLFELPLAARRTKADLVHVQYNMPFSRHCPYVVSVHDVVWKRYPEMLRAADRYRLATLVPLALRRAARVFVLTQAMADEISDVYKIKQSKFDIVQPGVPPAFNADYGPIALDLTRKQYKLPENYILYVGALQPRKNLAHLAEAFARISARGYPHKLVITGKKAWLYGETLEKIEALNLGDKLMFTGFVPQHDLPKIMAAASVFAYISLYEGFGLPVAEAMACGVPVLISNDRAIAEVAGGGALECDPTDIDSIEHGLERLIDDAELRATLRAKGIKRATIFTRARMAHDAVAGYARAIMQ